MQNKINTGDVLRVLLPDGRHTYVQISTSPLAIFYDYAAHNAVELTSIPSTLSEVKNLECAAVWNKSSIEERLIDYFGKKTNEWKKRLEIKLDKVPEYQKI